MESVRGNHLFLRCFNRINRSLRLFWSRVSDTPQTEYKIGDNFSISGFVFPLW